MTTEIRRTTSQRNMARWGLSLLALTEAADEGRPPRTARRAARRRVRRTRELARPRSGARRDPGLGLGRDPELHRRRRGRARDLDHHVGGDDDQVARRHGAAGRGEITVMTAREPLTPESSTGVFQRRWRELSAQPGSLRPVSIAITASFTVDTLLPYLGGLLAQRGLYARFTVAPFGQIYQSLLDPGSEVRAAE